jgi:hypothetical protein
MSSSIENGRPRQGVKCFAMSASLILPILLVLAALPARSETSVDAHDMMRRAAVAEGAERDLEEAVRLYEAVAGTEAAPPVLRAQARLKAGQCLERLGRSLEAQAAYEEASKAAGASLETLSAARDGLARIEDGRRAAAALAAPRPPSGPRWSLSVDGGPAFRWHTLYPPLRILPGDSPGLGNRHDVLWVSLGHRVARPLSVGVEWGEFLASRKEVVELAGGDGSYNYQYRDRITWRGSYVGPFLRLERVRRSVLWASLGFGFLSERARWRHAYEAYDAGTGALAMAEASETSAGGTDMAFPLAAGVDWKVGGWGRVGLGLREVVVFSRRSNEGYSGRLSRREVFFMTMPFLRCGIVF